MKPPQPKSSNFSNYNKNLNILTTNIRSLTKNSDSLNLFVNGKNFEIICLSETWLKPSIDDSTALGSLASSFRIIRCDRKRKKGGGVAVIYRDFMQLTLIFAETVPNGYELLVVDAQLPDSKIRFIVGYRAPTCEPNLNYQFCKAIGDLNTVEFECIVCGDFNLPQISWATPLLFPDNASKQLENCTLQLGFKQIIHSPTRLGNVLDLVFIAQSSVYAREQMHPPIGTSDHNTFTFSLSVRDRFPVQEPSDRLDYKNANYPAIFNLLTGIDWHGQFQKCRSSNEMYEVFVEILQLAIHRYVPAVACSGKEVTYPQYLRNLTQQTQRLWLKYVTTKTSTDLQKYKETNSILCKKLEKFLRNSEEKFLSNGASKQIYQYVARKTAKKADITIIKDSCGNLHSTSDACAEALAKHFAAVHRGPKITTPDKNSNSLPTMIHSPYFTKDSILKAILSCKKTYSLTPDGIPSIFVVNIASLLCAPLEIIFNNSLHSGEIPKSWKHAYITPIPKKNNNNDVTNFRPISITSIFARIFERLLRRSINLHIFDTKFISNHQHGFVKGKSVETQMLECMEIWTKILDKGGSVDIIYFDFEKAFDKVHHVLLLSKLKSAGLHPKICRWLENYLSRRTFQVKVGNTFSPLHDVENGVPQGSCIAPTLFNIFTHELPDLLAQGGVFCKLFADDTKIFREVTETHGKLELQAAIDRLSNWAKVWGLPLSVNKTQILHLGNKNPRYLYSIDGVPINVAAGSVRDLGFLITPDLSLKPHALKMVQNANLKTFNLFKNLKIRNKFTWLKIYKTYIRPILEFGPTILNGDPSISRILESAQNGFTRKLFFRSESIDYSQIPSAVIRNRALNIDDLKHRRDVADIKMISKLLSEHSALNKELFFSFTKSRTRGSTIKIRYPIAKKAIRNNSFSVRVGRLYIKLTKKYKIPKTNKAISKLLKK